MSDAHEELPQPSPSEQPEEAAADAPGVDALAALEGFEFVIERDGTVTFVDFPPELVDIAYALNPDDPLVCERRALLREGAGPPIAADAWAEPSPAVEPDEG